MIICNGRFLAFRKPQSTLNFFYVNSQISTAQAVKYCLELLLSKLWLLNPTFGNRGLAQFGVGETKRMYFFVCGVPINPSWCWFLAISLQNPSLLKGFLSTFLVHVATCNCNFSFLSKRESVQCRLLPFNIYMWKLSHLNQTVPQWSLNLKTKQTTAYSNTTASSALHGSLS